MVMCDYFSAASDEVRARPRSGELLSDPEAEEAFVIGVPDTLRVALATASDDQLELAAGLFGAVEEVDLPPDRALELLHLLSGLARRATAEDRRLYCWWAL
ncbi:hypothetical protein [Streptomyces sp. NPDC051576]|uniref:hypothetical protein n=1 Tax=Streptomyces sp. NPDC051576 TaxID=3155803 RepID=UPI003445AF0C